MKNIFNKIALLTISLTCLLFAATPAEAYVSVRGYYRSNGTYVQPHVRSNPNGLKYDNYSWTPSQGLYNKSYGARGTTWDTPTWTTDPDYYTGLQLYQNKSAYLNSSLPSISPNITVTTPSVAPYYSTGLPDTTATGTTSIQSMLTATTSNTVPIIFPAVIKPEVNDIFKETKMLPIIKKAGEDQWNYCEVHYGIGALYSWSSNSCFCKENFTYNDESGSCVTNEFICVKQHGNHSYFNTNIRACSCLNGYTMSGGICETSITTPLNDRAGLQVINGHTIQTFNDGSQLDLNSLQPIRGAIWVKTK